MFERFTDRARKVMAMANRHAQLFNHEYVGAEHILLGLISEGGGVGVTALKNMNIDLNAVSAGVQKLIKRGPDTVTMGKLPLTPRAKKVVEFAIDKSRELNHNYIGTEHLLLGLVKEEGTACDVLRDLGATAERIREEVLLLLSINVDSNENAQPPTSRAVIRKHKTGVVCSEDDNTVWVSIDFERKTISTPGLLDGISPQRANLFAEVLREAADWLAQET